MRSDSNTMTVIHFPVPTSGGSSPFRSACASSRTTWKWQSGEGVSVS